jgi:hypothetical protein
LNRIRECLMVCFFHGLCNDSNFLHTTYYFKKYCTLKSQVLTASYWILTFTHDSSRLGRNQRYKCLLALIAPLWGKLWRNTLIWVAIINKFPVFSPQCYRLNTAMYIDNEYINSVQIIIPSNNIYIQLLNCYRSNNLSLVADPEQIRKVLYLTSIQMLPFLLFAKSVDHYTMNISSSSSFYFNSNDPGWLMQAIGCRTSQNIYTK